MRLSVFILSLLTSLSVFGQDLFAPNLVLANPVAASASLLFATGQTIGTPRNNFSGSTGCTFTNGAASVTVTHLGRWVISGNSQTHVVSLFAWCGNGAGGNCDNVGPALSDATYLGQVTVNCSGATPGQYLYVALGSPATLAANTKFAIVSVETSGGDQFSDDNTALTLSADFALGSSVYSDSNYRQNTATKSYGPLNFKYTKP